MQFNVANWDSMYSMDRFEWFSNNFLETNADKSQMMTIVLFS